MEHEAFSPESERYMIGHMNDHHADSNLLYAKVYGQLWEATEASMVRLDKTGMEMNAVIAGETRRIRIPFDHTLQDEGDAQQTLVEMSFKAHDILAARTNG
jgi:putative heme iron utilization protein